MNVDRSLDQTGRDVTVDVDLEEALASTSTAESARSRPRLGDRRPGGGALGSVPLLITGIVLAIIGLVVVQTLETRRAASQTETVERSSRLLALSQQVSVDASDATRGDDAAFDTLRAATEEFSSIIDTLDQGDGEAGIEPLAEPQRSRLAPVASLWNEISNEVDTILRFRDVLSGTRQQVQIVNELAPLLLTRADEVVEAVIIESGDANLVNESARQRSLSQRIAKDINIFAKGEIDAAAAAGQIGRDLADFQTSLSQLRRVSGPVTLARLEGSDRVFNDLLASITSIFQGSAGFFEAQTAALNIRDQTDQLLPAVQALVQDVTMAGPPGLMPYAPWALGALIILFLLLLGRALVNDARRRADQNARQNRETQDAILKLLDEMGSLADGDLTIEAEVTDQITGAIADSVNFAVNEMRGLVSRINDASRRVARESQGTSATARELANVSAQQARHISNAAEVVQSMSRSMEGMSGEAVRSAEVAKHSVEVAKRGAQAVRETIHGMDEMRDRIQETSKRIKRLGESSQQINDIVALIDDIAEQTNILSLNAAIQAAMAGEAGRGFAVVADEVQRLAERSAEATKQITGLVKNIQADTNEAVASMEQATQGMVDGTRLADAAGQALGEIESVSEKLSELINRMADAAHRQSESAQDVSGKMASIREVTGVTAKGATSTAESIGKLSALARELEQSVAGFKIPV